LFAGDVISTICERFCAQPCGFVKLSRNEIADNLSQPRFLIALFACIEPAAAIRMIDEPNFFLTATSIGQKDAYSMLRNDSPQRAQRNAEARQKMFLCVSLR